MLATRANSGTEKGASRPVLFVSAEKHYGGAEKSLMVVLHQSPPSGLEAVMLSRPGAAIGQKAQKAGLKVIEKTFLQRSLARRPIAYLSGLIRLLGVARSLRPALIFGDGWRTVPYVVPIGRLLGIPTFIHLRDGDLPPSRMTRAFCRRADFTTQISQWQQDFLLAHRLIHKGRCRMIYNGLEPEIYLREGRPNEQQRAELGLASDEIGVVLPGYLLPWKGGEVFLDAINLLCEKCPRARFYFLGGAFPDTGSGADESFPARLHALVEGSVFRERIDFLGHRDDVADVLWRMDIAVVPTTTEEAFGRVAVEAMLAGLPVVATRSGGLPEIVVDGETGLIVPTRDTKALAEAIEHLLVDEPLRGRMGVAGRERALELFSAKRKAEQMWAAIQEVTG